MKPNLYDQYAMAALTGLLVDPIEDSEGIPMDWATERASTIAMKMLDLKRQRKEQIEALLEDQ